MPILFMYLHILVSFIILEALVFALTYIYLCMCNIYVPYSSVSAPKKGMLSIVLASKQCV